MHTRIYNLKPKAVPLITELLFLFKRILPEYKLLTIRILSGVFGGFPKTEPTDLPFLAPAPPTRFFGGGPGKPPTLAQNDKEERGIRWCSMISHVKILYTAIKSLREKEHIEINN